MLKGHLDVLLLATVEDSPAHGYAVIERLRDRSAGDFDLPEGTIYPVLRRLEAGRLVASKWETVEGRDRRVYRLTVRGKRALERGRKEWQVFRDAVGSVLSWST